MTHPDFQGIVEVGVFSHHYKVWVVSNLMNAGSHSDFLDRSNRSLTSNSTVFQSTFVSQPARKQHDKRTNQIEFKLWIYQYGTV